MSRKALQWVLAILAIIPVATGLLGLLGIYDPVYASANLPAHALLDSNLRFFSGLWIGFGLAIAWLIPSIERQTVLFRALWVMIFVGGIGRLLSCLSVGLPPVPFIFLIGLELLGAPLFIYWQHRVAQTAHTMQTVALPDASAT